MIAPALAMRMAVEPICKVYSYGDYQPPHAPWTVFADVITHEDKSLAISAAIVYLLYSSHEIPKVAKTLQ